MRPDPTVIKETRIILLGETILTALMIAVYLIISRFSLPVLFGALLGAALAVLNFFLMGLTVQKALTLPPEDHQKWMRSSLSLRMMGIVAVLAVGIAVFHLEVIPTVLPLIFPRLTVFVRGFFLKDDQNSDS